MHKEEVKKNVLYVGGFDLPDKNAAAQRVLANAKLFHSMGYKVSFIGVDAVNGTPVLSPKTLEIDGYSFKYWCQQYPSSLKEWGSFLTSIKFIKKVIKEHLHNEIDIVVVYNYPAITFYKVLLYCQKHNYKLLGDVTEWYHPEGSLAFRLIKGLDSFLRMRILHKKATGLIVISSFLKNYYHTTKTIVLPPLIDKNSKKWEAPVITSDSCIKLVYAGSAGSGIKDRIDYIISSLSRIKKHCKSFEFVIVGMTEKEYLHSFPETKIPINIKENIVFIGRRSHLDTIKYIKEAHYSIFLRDQNRVNTAGFPTKFVESISCNTPVLTNSSSDLKKYMHNQEIGFLLDNSSAALLDKSLIKALTIDNEYLQAMKYNCYTYRQFHFESYKTQFKKFITSL